MNSLPRYKNVLLFHGAFKKGIVSTLIRVCGWNEQNSFANRFQC